MTKHNHSRDAIFLEPFHIREKPWLCLKCGMVFIQFADALRRFV